MAKKRRMPAHIVLPNGMWRFIKGKAKTAVGKSKKNKKRKSYSGGIKMAKKKGYKRSGRSSFMTRGFLPVGGLIGSALIGAGAAELQEKFLPQAIPYQSVAAGFLVGGVGGAAGAFARNMLKGNTGTSSAGVTGYGN